MGAEPWRSDDDTGSEGEGGVARTAIGCTVAIDTPISSLAGVNDQDLPKEVSIPIAKRLAQALGPTLGTYIVLIVCSGSKSRVNGAAAEA
ncbi:unnamed protein product [Caenorhabditis auriculariae]|uniref:Uncharacterized protein n=1 Tax=Caenorhabditis auriculariae TaxID=2777116 RepID=A0A8S1GVD7_9PELO|nr:unnamed protein product [Caenorhabditis auriculariae]